MTTQSVLDHDLSALDKSRELPDERRRPGPLDSLAVAYLVNQHPSPSITFIRREIIAMEKAGATVRRFSIRRWPGQVIDPTDIAEAKQTEVLLDRGVGMLVDAILCFLQSPARFWRALQLCVRVGWKSDRGTIRTLIYLLEACHLKQRLATCQIGWVHAHFGTNSAAVAMFCHVLGGPRYSFTVHGPEEFDRPELLHLREKIQYASMVVAISQFCRSQLYRWCDASCWPKIRIVRCGVSESFAGADLLPIPPEPRLVCVARLAEQKGLPILIEAAAMLHRQGVDFHLELIGDGDLRADIERLLDQHGLRGVVTLSGWRTEAQIRQSIEHSRALVLPSFAEGLPVVLMEALALGRPVISTRIAGVAELIDDHENGWLINAGDTTALAAAMFTALTTDTDRLEAMGYAGRAKVLESHLAADEAIRLGKYLLQFQSLAMKSPPESILGFSDPS